MTRRSPRTTTACRSTWRCRRRRSTGASTTRATIPIEERDADEVRRVAGRDDYGRPAVSTPAAPRSSNYGVRRHAGAPRHRPRHRARHCRAGAARRDISRTGGQTESRRMRPEPRGAAPAGMTVIAEDGPTLREAVIATALAMNAAGINAANRATSRCAAARRIRRASSSRRRGLPYDRTAADDVVFDEAPDGEAHGSAPRRPRNGASIATSTRRDASARAIVHTHAPFATALACHGRGIPAFHYMVAVAGGADIRCAPVRDVRHAGAVGSRARRARRTPRLPARQSRHDRLGASLARRSPWPSRSRRSRECIGGAFRSASRRRSPPPRWRECWRRFATLRPGHRQTSRARPAQYVCPVLHCHGPDGTRQ